MATLRGSQSPDPRSEDRSRAPATAAGGERPFLEIQYHPGDIRQGVRYLFLTRRQIFWWVTGGIFYLALLIFGLTITPKVIANHLNEQRLMELKEERVRAGKELRSRVEQLTELEGKATKALSEMSKIHLAYGLPNEGQGQGGYPSSPAPQVETRSIFQQEIGRGYELKGLVEDRMKALEVFFEEVRIFEDANRDQVATTPSLSPLRRESFVMTSPFGNRRSPFTKEIDFHPGIDLAATTGTPIYAPASGTVTFAGRFPLKQSVAWWRYGNLVALKNGERFMTLYGHCDEIKVKVGQQVGRGDVIATVGDTGWSTNPHLHYEVRWRDTEGKWHPVDPRIYILNHRWRDQERMLIQARKAPSIDDYEPLPRVIGR